MQTVESRLLYNHRTGLYTPLGRVLIDIERTKDSADIIGAGYWKHQE